jgi:hypothetical protein
LNTVNLICYVLGAFSFSPFDFHRIGLEQDLGGKVLDNTEEESNAFSTTWSFQTSEDPWTAGSMSDVRHPI